MAKLLRYSIALSLCVALALTAPTAFAAEPFTYTDLAVNGVPAGASPAEAVAVLGEPLAKDDPVEIPATGDIAQQYHYDGLTLTFTDGLLSGAEMSTQAYTGPRNLAVGVQEETLLQTFPYDEAIGGDGVLYASGWVEALGQPLPPSGTMDVEDNGALCYTYLAPVTPYSAELLAEPEAYVYEQTAMLIALVDPDTRVISSLMWAVQALAE